MKLSSGLSRLRSAIATGTAVLALTTSVQAQIQPLIEPASIMPPGAVGLMSGTQLINHGGASQVGGHFIGQSGEIYVRSSPTTIHQVTSSLTSGSYLGYNSSSQHVSPSTGYQFNLSRATHATVLPATVNLTHPTPPARWSPPAYQYIGEGTPEIRKIHEDFQRAEAAAEGIPYYKYCSEYGPIGACVKWE